MEEKRINRIDEFIGGTYMYRSRSVTIKGYVVNGDSIEIKTSGNSIKTTVAGLGDTLDELLPVHTPQDEAVDAKVKDESLAIFENNGNNLSTLEDVLMENINKLKNDPKYLNQAKEINTHADSMIKIAKVKVEMVREIRKHRQL